MCGEDFMLFLVNLNNYFVFLNNQTKTNLFNTLFYQVLNLIKYFLK